MSGILEHLPRPVALICGYGEQNAAAQAGMLEPLLADGWEPDIIVGSSAGAITAGAVMLGEEPAAQAQEIWRAVAESKVAHFGWTRMAAALAGNEGSRVTRQWLALFEPLFGDADIGPRQGFVATDLTHGEAVLLTEGRIADAILAAAAFPILTAPATLDDAILVDGGFTAPLPTLQALALGAASIVALDTGRAAHNAESAAPTRWYQLVLSSVRHQVAAIAAHDTAAAALAVPVVVLACAEPFGVAWEDVDERIEVGRVRTVEQLAALARRWRDVSEPGVYTASDVVIADKRLTGLIR